MNKSANEVARIHIPIHLLLNKYGNAAINGWDGNSVSIDANGNGVILAPQIGAGQKEADNSFTGMLMGSVKEAGKNKKDIGMFGYNFGERTMFLNAEDGSAIFGKHGPGQIILDPAAAKAMLYSSSYWKNYDDSGKPLNYNSGNKNNQGMLIDLTTPRIEWGNGNFVVDENGHLTAKGGGILAGFNIDDDSIYTGTKSSSTNVRFSSNNGLFSRTINGTNRENLNLAINNKFAVDNNGALYSSSGQIGGWTINGTELQSNNGNTHISANGTLKGPNWEINASGNAHFKNIRIDNGGWTQGTADLINYGTRFRVESNGTLHASNGQFSGDINGSSISGGSVSGAYISGGSINVDTSGGGYLRAGTDTTHVNVSGLNVGWAGVKAYSGVTATSFSITDGDTGKDFSIQVPRQGGGYYYMTFTGGILTAAQRYD